MTDGGGSSSSYLQWWIEGGVRVPKHARWLTGHSVDSEIATAG